MPSTFQSAMACDVGVDADLQEEDRDEQVADRRQLAADAVGRAASGEREPGDERADDRRELGRCASSANGEREGEARAPRGCLPTGCSARIAREERRREPEPDHRRDDEEADRHHDDPDDAERETLPSVDERGPRRSG